MRNKTLTKNCILENYMNIKKIIEILKYLVMMNDFHAQRFIFFSYSIENVSSISIISHVCESLSLLHFHWKDWKTTSDTFSSLVDTDWKIITDIFSSLINTNWKTFTNFLLFSWFKMLINFQCIHERKRKSSHFRDFAKFIFEIISLHSKYQWIKNIAKFFNNFFKVIDYHEEFRFENTVNVLIKKHEIFRFDLNIIVRIIVIFIFHTWNKRHDFQKRNEYKKKHSTISWFHNLIDLFDNEFIDETHVIKNINVEITIVMLWFEILFWILIIDTMFANDIKNFKKFMKLLQHKKTNE